MYWLYRTIAILGVCTLALTGCSSSGGDSNNNGGGGTPQTTSASAGVASTLASIQITAGVMGMAGLDPTTATTFAQPRSMSVMTSAKRIYRHASQSYDYDPLTLQAGPCQGGGSLNVSVFGNGFGITFDNCRTIVNGIEQFSDGTIDYEETASGFTLNTDFVKRETRVSDSRLLNQEVQELSFTGTFSGTPFTCKDESQPSNVSITLNGSIAEQEDENVDGVIDVNERSSFANFNTTLVATQLGSDCEPLNFTATLTGEVQVTDEIDTDASRSLTIASGGLTLMGEATPDGELLSVDGGFTIVSSCFTGSLTLVTVTPLLFPDLDDDDCPASGEIMVSGDQTATFVFTASGGLEVDLGSDGSVDETFDDCDDTETCSA